MMIKVFYFGSQKELQTDGQTTLEELLEMNNLPVENVEIKINGILANTTHIQSYMPQDGDRINILAGKQASGAFI